MFIEDFKFIPPTQAFDCDNGNHLVKILAAKVVNSKRTNKRMIEVRLKVDGSNGTDYIDRIVEGDYFNQNMSRYFVAFGINNFNFDSWIGLCAEAMFSHRDETFKDQNGQDKTVNKCYLVKLVLREDIQNQASQQDNSWATPIY